ncbi:hypothetical protein [Novosphingobium ginsenosidimutans]|uniref:Lipoprotein n=1 Tax=Novosphingobium ginsenosidimutans TaxID=1176536 RepID=A0A5B8S2M3_9SPHN|nr:hypothetical protein [Novosphingobium ginsenosidimutans]QEA15701.1 hypothetical protein FRF71_05890 [Novosphingobium ginsenosidimutans]
MLPKSLLLLALIPALAACASSSAPRSASVPVKPTTTRPATRPAMTPVRPPVRTPPPTARIQSLPGLEGVIGSSAAELVRQFGQPRLDVAEGDARKLQYVGTACVLDIFLYPAQPGREPQTTYVEARRASDGQEVDRAACVAALRSR